MSVAPWSGCNGLGGMPSPNPTGWRPGGGSRGDDMESDGASLNGPQPDEGENESSLGVSPTRSECGLEPKGIDRPNPTVGFFRLQADEQVTPRGPLWV
jgi:hypothetical protein